MLRIALIIGVTMLGGVGCDEEEAAAAAHTSSLFDFATSSQIQLTKRIRGDLFGYAADSFIQFHETWSDPRPAAGAEGSANFMQRWYFDEAGSSVKGDGSAYQDYEMICEFQSTIEFKGVDGFDSNERMQFTEVSTASTCGSAGATEHYVLIRGTGGVPGDFSWWILENSATEEVPQPYWLATGNAQYPRQFCDPAEALSGRPYCEAIDGDFCPGGC
jgi:hypothetical protein